MSAFGIRLGAGDPPPPDTIDPLVKLIVRHPHSVEEGTGFFVEATNWGYLVITARHVLLGDVQSISVVCSANGTDVPLDAAAFAYEIGTATAADVGLVALATEASVTGYPWGTAPSGKFPAVLSGFAARTGPNAPFPPRRDLDCIARTDEPLLRLSTAGLRGMSGGPMTTNAAVLDDGSIGFGVVGLHVSTGLAIELPASSLNECSDKIREVMGL